MEHTGAGAAVCLVVPCFNEKGRMRPDEFKELASQSGVSLIFVDDGSTDGTRAVLEELAATSPMIRVLTIDHNGGKGEAVRRGLLEAVHGDADWVGHVDADLATPVSEIVRLVTAAATHAEADVVLGARVALLGRRITRSAFRHYTGRVFATLASLALAKPVYDTQNGAKLFRRGAAIEAAIAEPFRSRWAFDVELLGRLEIAGVPATAFWEEPLLAWHDAPGSKRSLRSSVQATAELVPIWNDLRRRRRRQQSP